MSVYYHHYKEELDIYPSYKYLGRDGIEYIAIGATEEDLEEFKFARDHLYGDDLFRAYGELFGFPPSAIEDFVNHDNLNTDKAVDDYRCIIDYYGLKFTCKEQSLSRVGEELREMYGLPFKDEMKRRVQ